MVFQGAVAVLSVRGFALAAGFVAAVRLAVAFLLVADFVAVVVLLAVALSVAGRRGDFW